MADRDKRTDRADPPRRHRGNPTFNSSQLFINAAVGNRPLGKLRRATEAARAELLSTEEARRTVILTLVTSVASAYIDLRDLDKQLEIAKKTAKYPPDESYKIFEQRFEAHHQRSN